MIDQPLILPVETESWQRDLEAMFSGHLYVATRGASCNYWRGRHMLKQPTDLWSYTEIIQQFRPDAIVETGAWQGGSAAYFADVQRMEGITPCVVSIDVEEMEPYPGVWFLQGRSTEDRILHRVGELIAHADNVLVSLDSDHSRENVLAELRAYSPCVAPGGWLVVEDTNTEGPAAAVAEWLPGSGFHAAREPERWAGLTFHPGGWLRRD